MIKNNDYDCRKIIDKFFKVMELDMVIEMLYKLKVNRFLC